MILHVKCRLQYYHGLSFKSTFVAIAWAAIAWAICVSQYLSLENSTYFSLRQLRCSVAELIEFRCQNFAVACSGSRSSFCSYVAVDLQWII